MHFKTEIRKDKRKQQFGWLILLLGIAMISSCSTIGAKDSATNPPVSVVVQEVKAYSAEQEIDYSGTIEETMSAPLTFSVIGTVSKVFVAEGETVHKGQALATLDAKSWKDSYEMASAQEKQAQDAYERMLPMHERGSLPEIKFVEIETGLQQARSAAAIAKRNVDDCTLYATMNGIVGRRTIEPGMGVSSALNAITIVRIDTVYAKISVSEGEIAALKKGMSAQIVVSALNKAHFVGVVEQVGVLADPMVHTYKVKIAIPNPDHKLLPGMLCNVVLTNPTSETCVVIPTGCLSVDENGKHFLFVADPVKHLARRVDVVPGAFVKTGIKILTGLQAGELVVVAGQQKLTDQSAITIYR